MFLLVLAHPGSSGQSGVKLLCVCVCLTDMSVVCRDVQAISITGPPECVSSACKEILQVVQQEAAASSGRGLVCLSAAHCVI